MRIQPGAFREEHNWQKYVTFASREDGELSLVFLWRLAAFCRDFKVISILTIGYRSYERQKELYDLYMAGKGNPAAKPGSSWHEAHLAVDLRDIAEGGWFRRFSGDFLMPFSTGMQGIKQYGLIAPLNKMDKPTGPIEWWHWQPVETDNYAGDRMKYLHPDDAIAGHPVTVRKGDSGVWVSELQALLKRTSTGRFDDALDVAVRSKQRALGLFDDGIVGPKSWVAFYSRW